MFYGFANLVERRGLNGGVELKGVKLTRWQLEGLRDYVRYDPLLKFVNMEIDYHGVIVVENYSDSDLLIK